MAGDSQHTRTGGREDSFFFLSKHLTKPGCGVNPSGPAGLSCQLLTKGTYTFFFHLGHARWLRPEIVRRWHLRIGIADELPLLITIKAVQGLDKLRNSRFVDGFLYEL